MSREQLPTVFALDFGTSSLKAGLIDLEGNLLWSGRRVFPQVPNYHNWHTSQWLFAMEELLSDFSTFAGTRSRPNASAPEMRSSAGTRTRAPNARASRAPLIPNAISISGNGPSLVMLSSQYADQRRAHWPVLLWMTSANLSIEGGKSMYLPKINYLREHDPAGFKKTCRFLSTAEYITWVLCGSECAISPTEEFSEYIWTEQSLKTYGLSSSLFPAYRRPGEVIGTVDRTGADVSGLPEGLPVICSSSDFLMSLLGTGVIEDGLCCDRAGTSEGINYCSRKAPRFPQPRMRRHVQLIPHLREGYYNIAGILSGTGRIFEWFRQISHQQDVSYIDMMKKVLAVSGSVPQFFPSVHTIDDWEFNGGIFAGLQPNHGSAECGLAIINAIAFGIRMTLERMNALGCAITSMRSCGGQAKNDLWCQMKADISSTRIEVPRIEDAELTGSAIMGFIGLGYFASLTEGVEGLVTIAKHFEPNPLKHEEYTEQYHHWMKSWNDHAAP